ncbi:DNA methyltransferase [Archangium sp.]|uniref:DNA methyltransferase n=1 Tax=Archangium sp. TaxID=1872627 RepID=UPI002D6F8D00|nr:DNA methyltransferase [Archangium sp.]HYO59834.1 DNA methyltransferase [Archangium sp.]
MCSYLGCFPPAVPRRLIQKLVPEGGLFVDPFCGSGTSLVEGLLEGRRSVGIDLNPLAVALASAKIQQVTLDDVTDRLIALATGYRGVADTEHVPDGLRIIFHPRTLTQLAYLRESLDLDRPEDIFIRGAVLGIMHGKFKKGGKDSMYLSIDMPNTFSMSPQYVQGFVRKHQLKQLPFDVFGKTRDRVKWLLREGCLPWGLGVTVVRGDATQMQAILKTLDVKKVDAVITSPPYLGVLRYGAFNWIRLWFLGCEPAPVDRLLDSTDSLDRYLSFMTSVLLSAAKVLRPGAPIALVIGDVVEFGRSLQLAIRVWEELKDVVPYRFVDIKVDDFDDSTKTTRIWGEGKKGQATPLDRILILERAPDVPGRKPRQHGLQRGQMRDVAE